MPKTNIVLYRETDGSVPLLEWLDGLGRKARAKCIARLQRLAELGHELRRPDADLLRDGIYELRVTLRRQNYRMLYFFHGQVAAVLSHGLLKERIVPSKEIELAIKRKREFEADPEAHTSSAEESDG
ncbi:MAG TPA: type II toxin-antitoxin system RelE/ParE family toxin [Pirellulaceae bacterium]|jgi:phage-related protein